MKSSYAFSKMRWKVLCLWWHTIFVCTLWIYDRFLNQPKCVEMITRYSTYMIVFGICENYGRLKILFFCIFFSNSKFRKGCLYCFLEEKSKVCTLFSYSFQCKYIELKYPDILYNSYIAAFRVSIFNRIT